MNKTVFKLSVLALAVTLSNMAIAGTAIGDGAVAKGVSSTAIGENANASGDYSTATGKGSNASGWLSTATGVNSDASGFGSSSTGSNSTASGGYSTANGSLAKATGSGSTATGSGAKAFGNNSTATGISSYATGDNSTAMGGNSYALADNSVALGNGSVADRDNTVSVGREGNERQITNVADGTKDTDAANVRQVNSSKNEAINTANNYTDQKFNSLGGKIDRVEKKLNAGIAGVTAIASIPYVAENNFSYGVGMGNYSNGNAIAGGVQYKTSPNTNIRLNVSWDSSSNAALGVGFAGGW